VDATTKCEGDISLFSNRQVCQSKQSERKEISQYARIAIAAAVKATDHR
jgi:hypothetical protein